MMTKSLQTISSIAQQSLHLTAIPLRSIAAGELGRYANKEML